MPLPLDKQADRAFEWHYRHLKKYPDIHKLVRDAYLELSEKGRTKNMFSGLAAVQDKYACPFCKLIKCAYRNDHAVKHQRTLRAMAKLEALHIDSHRSSMIINQVVDDPLQLSNEQLDALIEAKLKKLKEL